MAKNSFIQAHIRSDDVTFQSLSLTLSLTLSLLLPVPLLFGYSQFFLLYFFQMDFTNSGNASN